MVRSKWLKIVKLRIILLKKLFEASCHILKCKKVIDRIQIHKWKLNFFQNSIYDCQYIEFLLKMTLQN